MDYAGVLREITELVGRRIILRPVALAMAEELLKAVEESRKELHRFMGWETRTVDDAKTFIENAMAKCKNGSGLELAIYEPGTEVFAGIIGLGNFHPDTPKGEVGYWTRSSKVGLGYATNAVSTLLEFCRDQMKIVRVDACVAISNTASQMVLMKCGFQEEGFKQRGLFCHGVWHDIKLFGKLLA